MSRTRRSDNTGMHQIVNVPARPYGKCPHCQQLKPMHWISRTAYLCYACMKATGAKPYYPTFAARSVTSSSDMGTTS